MSAIFTITVTGVEAINVIGAEVPDMGPESVEPLIRHLAARGVEVGKATLTGTSTSIYKTGRTAEAMKSEIDQINTGVWRALIGPATGLTGKHRIYPFFVSIETQEAQLNRAVQLFPYQVRWGSPEGAMWRFLKKKPTTPKHPWMQDIAQMVEDEAVKKFGEEISSKVVEINKKVQEAQLREMVREE